MNTTFDLIPSLKAALVALDEARQTYAEAAAGYGFANQFDEANYRDRVEYAEDNVRILIHRIEQAAKV